MHTDAYQITYPLPVSHHLPYAAGARFRGQRTAQNPQCRRAKQLWHSACSREVGSPPAIPPTKGFTYGMPPVNPGNRNLTAVSRAAWTPLAWVVDLHGSIVGRLQAVYVWLSVTQERLVYLDKNSFLFECQVKELLVSNLQLFYRAGVPRQCMGCLV